MLFGRKKSDSDEEFKKAELQDMQKQINNLKSNMENFRILVISANISNEQKQEAFKKLDEAEGYLKSAENNINQNNMAEAKKNFIKSLESIDQMLKGINYWLERWLERQQQ